MRRGFFLLLILSGLAAGHLVLSPKLAGAEKTRFWVTISTKSGEDATRACRNDAAGAKCGSPIGGCVTNNYIALAVGISERFAWATTSGAPSLQEAVSNALKSCNANSQRYGAQCSMAGYMHPGCLFAVPGCVGDCRDWNQNRPGAGDDNRGP
jgi:hypothetical protein